MQSQEEDLQKKVTGEGNEMQCLSRKQFLQTLLPKETGENGRVLAAAQELTDSILLKQREIPPLHSIQEKRGSQLLIFGRLTVVFSHLVMTLIVFSQKHTFMQLYKISHISKLSPISMNCNTFLTQSKPKSKMAFPCLYIPISHIFHPIYILASSIKDRIKIKFHFFFNSWKKVKMCSKIGTLLCATSPL